jgi:hypothetical protein
MADIGSGRRRNARRALNFTSNTAQARLDEQLHPFRDKVENALAVDAVDIVLMRRTRIGIPCSCSHSVMTIESLQSNDDYVSDSESSKVTLPTNQMSGGNASKVRIDLGSDTMFGEGVYDKHDYNPVESRQPKELSDFLNRDQVTRSAVDNPEDDTRATEHFLPTEFSGSEENCGVCYSEGFIPAFDVVNYKYQILAYNNISETYGYYQDTSRKPNVYVHSGDENSYVEFNILVPKYFVDVSYSIRNNEVVHPATFPLKTPTGDVVTRAYIESFRGKNMPVRVRDVREFTHATLIFKLLQVDIKGNINTEQDVLNYRDETTIGDIQVVLPESAGSLRSGDVIVIPKRNLVLKINNAPRKSTAKKELWQWSVTCRSLQRSEFLSGVFKSFKIY